VTKPRSILGEDIEAVDETLTAPGTETSSKTWLSNWYDGVWVDTARDPLAWYQSSLMLRNAARKIFLPTITRDKDPYPSPPGWIRLSPWAEPIGPYLLLVAYSLENLLKALIINDDPGLVTVAGLHRRVQGHNLPVLAERAKVTLANDDKATLEMLSTASTSYARYPIATKPKGDRLGPEDIYVDSKQIAAVFERLHKEWAEKVMARIGFLHTDL
jgi:hypothetical protein